MAALYVTGRWDEIPEVIDEHVAVFDGEADLSCPFARGGLPLGAIVLARRGEPTRAREVLDRLRRGTSEIGLEAALEAIAENALGRPEAGEARAREVFASGARSWDEEPPLEIVAVAEALAAQADWTALDAILPDLRSRAWLLAIAPPTLDWAEGVSAAARGDRTRARQLLRQAVDALDGLAVYEAARAREALASVAAAAYEGLGARPDAERLRRAEVSA
jgi:hypothetical protein